jgi:sterol desaturase/sphingolipid hydroxylase (fatty acid hydroxylase superfamily)
MSLESYSPARSDPSARRPADVEGAAARTTFGTRIAAAVAQRAGRLTHNPVNYWAGFVVDAVGVALFLALGLRASGPVPLTPCLAALLGWGVYTFCEYYAHRYLFHEPWSPFAHDHLAHHAAPRRTIGQPFFSPIVIAVVLCGACQWVLPGPHAYLFVAGAYLGWLYYGTLHHVEHAADFSLASYRRLRRHHLLHHAAMSTNFGVSTTLWDRVFGTHLERPRARCRDIA